MYFPSSSCTENPILHPFPVTVVQLSIRLIPDKPQELIPDAGRACCHLPLIRLSEMYYIAAECEPDFNTAKGYLETVRQHRGLSSYPLTCTDKQQLQDDIEQEYRKEFIAEGQLFYYYKRQNLSSIPFTAQTMNRDVYVFPVPDNELEFGDFKQE